MTLNNSFFLYKKSILFVLCSFDSIVPERSRQLSQLMSDIQSLRIYAIYNNQYQETATAEVLAVAHFSPKNRHIRVASSTDAPKVIAFSIKIMHFKTRFSHSILN